MWKSMRFCQVTHSWQRELKYSQVPHQIFVLFGSIFQDFFNYKVNILCIFWFNVSRLFLFHIYTQNSLHFNSPFSPLALLLLYIYLPRALHVIPC